jgi:hypothetical protein
MLAHGFTVERMVELVRAGLATATAERVVAGKPHDGSRDAADYRGGTAGPRMNADQSRIDELLARLSESLTVEVKRWVSTDEPQGLSKIVRGALALRNRNGGYFVIGFDDKTLQPDIGNEPIDVRAAFHTGPCRPTECQARRWRDHKIGQTSSKSVLIIGKQILGVFSYNEKCTLSLLSSRSPARP